MFELVVNVDKLPPRITNFNNSVTTSVAPVDPIPKVDTLIMGGFEVVAEDDEPEPVVEVVPSFIPSQIPRRNARTPNVTMYSGTSSSGGCGCGKR